jgi:uncharacterized protein
MINQSALLKLIRMVRSNFKVNHRGIHGTAHWSRVHDNGIFLYDNIIGNDPEGQEVITLFAYVHDSQRVEDGSEDLYHGVRAAEFAERVCVNMFDLSSRQIKLLKTACAGHTVGLYHDDPIIQICWDADRLDIGRCKEFVDPSFLGTDVAKRPEVIKMCTDRSRT